MEKLSLNQQKSLKNDQWLWLVLHKQSRQVLAMQVGPRNKKIAELLFAKLPESLKKKPSISQTNLMSIMKPFLGSSIDPFLNNQVKQIILKDLMYTQIKVCKTCKKNSFLFKKLANHIGMIKYFICHYNLMIRALSV